MKLLWQVKEAMVYGHAPPPTLTENESAVLSRLTDEFRPSQAFAGDLKLASVSVALVRLRNRGLVESEKRGTVNHWRRKSAETE